MFASLGVAAIVILSAILRIVLGLNVAGPWIFVDELIYSELGRSAVSGFEIRGVPVSGYGAVYPWLLAPAYGLFDNLSTAYAAVKVTNAIVMSSTAIPAYLIARTLMGRRWALVASTLSVLVPGMAYTGMVMTENAFYPAFALAMLFVVLALQRRKIIFQVLVFVGALLCFEIRPQGAVVAGAYVVSVVLLIALEALLAERGARARELGCGFMQFLPTWIIVVASVAGLAAYVQSRGTGIAGLLGAYSVTAQERDRYQAKPILSWFLLHISELDFWLGVIPFVAALVLIGVALTRASDRNTRAFACAIVPMTLLMAALVSAFVVFANVARIEERNLFYVGFLMLIALCWWAQTGFARPQQRWFVVAVAVGAIGPIALPYGAILTQSAVSDTFGVFVPFAIQSRILDPTITTYVVALGVIIVAVLLAWSGGRRSWILVVVVVAFMGVTGVAVDRRTDKAAAAAVAISSPRNWVDAALPAGATASVVFQGGSDPMRVWQLEFFNRAPKMVYTIGTPLAGALPDTVVNVQADGFVVDRSENPVSSSYVVADAFTAVQGEVMARDVEYGMVLYRTEGQVRVLGTVEGVYGDGWSGADITYTRLACDGGTISLEASENASIHPTPVTVTPYVGDTALPATQVSADVGSVQVPAQVTPVDGVCQVRFHVDPVITPAEAIGTSDTRPLGVIVRGFSFASTN